MHVCLFNMYVCVLRIGTYMCVVYTPVGWHFSTHTHVCTYACVYKYI